MNSSTSLPSLNAFTDGMLWMPNALEICGLASVSTLASATLPSRAVTAFSSAGVSARHGPHHSAQKSTIDGQLARALEDVALEGGVGGVEDHPTRISPLV